MKTVLDRAQNNKKVNVHVYQTEDSERLEREAGVIRITVLVRTNMVNPHIRQDCLHPLRSSNSSDYFLLVLTGVKQEGFRNLKFGKKFLSLSFQT